jgi:DNA-repair protein XRCC3
MASVFEMTRSADESPILAFGCEHLNENLRGGLRKGITELSGESGAGKTQLALQLLLQVQMPTGEGGLEGGAFFLSTEGEMPVDRLNQMQEGLKRKHPWAASFDFMEHIYITKVESVEEQEQVVMTRLPLLLEHKHIKLIVIDSIAGLFRVEFKREQSVERAEKMRDLAAQLKMISHQYNIPVLVTNQVTDVWTEELRHAPHVAHYSVISSGRPVMPALGLAWACCINTRLMISRSRCRTQRSLHTLSSPLIGVVSCEFVVEMDGVRGLSANEASGSAASALAHCTAPRLYAATAAQSDAT